jgi:hypothetical protein
MIKNNLKIIILIFTTIFMFSCENTNKSTEDQLPSLNGKNILMVYGGWDGHQPAVFIAKVSKLAQLKGLPV